MLVFGLFCGCRGFCHRTESDLLLFLVRYFLPYFDCCRWGHPCFTNMILETILAGETNWKSKTNQNDSLLGYCFTNFNKSLNNMKNEHNFTCIPKHFLKWLKNAQLVIVFIYTGQQKKGYKVICLLFYKTEWHILFAYCKHNVCCFRVDLPNLNHVQ